MENPVGVFIGATSGIGAHSDFEFAKNTTNPSIYISGRSEEKGNNVVSKCKELNPGAKVGFIKSDLTLVSSASEVANQIIEKEEKVNLLVLSCGSLERSNELSREGLPPSRVLYCYGR